MSERILVAVAWPYANGSLHLGQVAGAFLPPDIFARYHRMRGNEVLMVSGSDAHGTPVTLAAEQGGTSPEQISGKYQAEFQDNWERLGISFDLFTTTHTQNHTEVAQDIFLTLHKKGYIYQDTMLQPYCETDRRFLADRYVEGTCPHCGTERARGDQCDHCGRTLDPQDLIDMVCKICGNSPIIRETEHFFLKLSAFEEPLLKWVRAQTHWKPNVRNFTISFLEGGLRDRAITRDIEWGVPVPLEGYEGKRIYVWFEAVIGYLSATKEWAQSKGEPDRWTDFWQKECRAYYFIGKDNIPFHTIIWPAMLMGYGGLNLPYDVPANEFLNLEGLKLSTSRDWAVWLPEYLDRYEPDPLRYVLAASMPETSDSDFSWREYLRRNNDELVATYGNLVHRALTITYRSFQGEVPQPGTLDDLSNGLIQQAHQAIHGHRSKPGSLPVPPGVTVRYDPGPKGQPLPGPEGSLAGDIDQPRRRRLDSVGYADGGQLPQDPALSLSSLQLREAAPNAGLPGKPPGHRLELGPRLPEARPETGPAQAALRQAGRGYHREGDAANKRLRAKLYLMSDILSGIWTRQVSRYR